MNKNQLPSEMRAALEEHTAGGYLFVRIDMDGNVQTHADFDHEMAYLAILKKTENFLETLRTVDEIESLNFYESEAFETENEEDGEDDEHPD